jgi:hypothetical protein
MPKPVVPALNAAFVKAIEGDDGSEFFHRTAMIGLSSTPEALAA